LAPPRRLGLIILDDIGPESVGTIAIIRGHTGAND
jgi:hypothetical protein